MRIPAQTNEEHKQLITLINTLVGALMSLPDNIHWGESSWMHDNEFLDFVRLQTISLKNVTKNVIQGYYRDSFQLIRMIFEGYFVLRLISTCDKYVVRVRINTTKEDVTIEDAVKRLTNQAKKIFADRLLYTYQEKRKNILTAVVRGIPVVDDKKQETGVTIPIYYSAWNNFKPIEYHLKNHRVVEKYSTLRFLQGDWNGFPKNKRDLQDNYENLNFDKMLENLCLNEVLNKSTVTRVLVHYNFLSKFSHCTSESIQIIKTRYLRQMSKDNVSNIYNHYLSELALLYVCHLLSMHLVHTIYYLRWRKIKLKHKNIKYLSLLKRVEEEFGYFWFIFNKPHKYDVFDYANHKSNYRKKLVYRPENIRLRDVRYYHDPLERLKRLHSSSRELTSGNIYNSPFQRDDA